MSGPCVFCPIIAGEAEAVMAFGWPDAIVPRRPGDGLVMPWTGQRKA